MRTAAAAARWSSCGGCPGRAAWRRTAHGATAEKLSALGRVEDLGGAFRIYPREKSQVKVLARDIVELVNREGWKVEGMYSEAGQLDEVFRRITLPDTVKPQ